MGGFFFIYFRSDVINNAYCVWRYEKLWPAILFRFKQSESINALIKFPNHVHLKVDDPPHLPPPGGYSAVFGLH